MSTKKIKQILMCRPNNFQVEYQINPWMKPGMVNPKLALTQWHNLVNVFEKLNIIVHSITQDPELPDMVFSCDIGLVNNNQLLLSNFRFAQRRAETDKYLPWLRQYFKIKRIDKRVHFEGGDTVRYGDVILLGTGFRTDKQSCGAIKRLLNIEIISLELINSRFYHLYPLA